MRKTRTHRALRVAALAALSVLAGCALTLVVTIWVAGLSNTAEELSRRALSIETSLWPLVARIGALFTDGTSRAERDVWRTLIQMNATGPHNRAIAIGVDPVAMWPTDERESPRELRSRIVNGWTPGNPGTPDASAAVEHFLLQNEHAALVNCQDLPQHVACIPRAAFERHARESDGWSAFSQENKQIHEYLKVSRVGFNTSHSLALLYAEASCGLLCGGGGYYVFRRNGGSWHLVAYHQKWVS